MDITALVKNVEHVCCRYRLAAFRPLLEDAGHRLELRAWPASRLGGWLIPGKLGKADAVVLQRLLLPSWQLSRLRQQVKQLIFDFDDAVYLRDSYDPRAPDQRRLRRFVSMVRAADLVVAGNDFLAEQAARWTSSQRIHVVPTCVDIERYAPAEHVQQEGVRLVWVGSSSTLRGLERIRPLLEQLGQKIPGLSLKIVCDETLKINHVPVHFVPWSTATEAAELADADIGISWLPDDAWSRGKCGLKVLQYMAAGLPVVANPVGMQATLVEQGESGFLVRAPEDWFEAVALLAQSPALRQRLGRRGQLRARRQFAVCQGAAAWLRLLAKLPRTLAARCA